MIGARTNARDWTASVPTATRGIALVGYASIALFAGGFGVWAATAPLSGASIADGVIAAAGQNVFVQHLEGGIVAEVRVREGDRVTRGDVLFVMDATEARALRNRLAKQRVALEARQARQEAERDGADRLVLPSTLLAAARAEAMMPVVDEQRREFEARLARHARERAVLRQRDASLREQIAGLERQIELTERQRELVADETQRKKRLLDRGLAVRDAYTALVRAGGDLERQVAQSRAQMATANTQIVETAEQVARLETQRVERAVTELGETRTRLSDVIEQITAANARLDRIELRAPVDGIVVSLPRNKAGAVIAGGETLAEILPTTDDLIIEARIGPRDIDAVTVGDRATLRLSALDARTTPEVGATVTYVSADRLVDATSREPYYAARLRIDDVLPLGVARERIQPGMPVETFIATEDRTFLQYLVRPITDSFQRSFRED